MIIRKLFKFEGAHKVFNCSSSRCKYSNHGHSYIVEVFFETIVGLDNGQMVIDFGLMKETVGNLIDSFDHAYSMWDRMPVEEREMQKIYSQRWIQMPVSPSAEAYALLFLKAIDVIVNSTSFNNGEREPFLTAVRVHETATGYAEATHLDLDMVENVDLGDVIFSNGIIEEWKDKDFWNKIVEQSKKPREEREKVFINPTVEQQV